MVKNQAAKIKLLILDVDGVMTDGGITINEHGEELKTFNVKDGQGIIILINVGIDVVIITGRKSKAVEYRAKDLGIQEVYQGVRDKGAFCAELIRQKGLEKEQVCCVGDDLLDIPIFNRVGLSVAVADAAQEVCDAAHFITTNKGGKGAVREVCELILKAQGAWPQYKSTLVD